jgi:hypothetical protein
MVYRILHDHPWDAGVFDEEAFNYEYLYTYAEIEKPELYRQGAIKTFPDGRATVSSRDIRSPLIMPHRKKRWKMPQL